MGPVSACHRLSFLQGCEKVLFGEYPYEAEGFRRAKTGREVVQSARLQPEV